MTMTALPSRLALVFGALVLTSATACKGELGFLTPEEEIGDRFPDEELELEVERTNPGHELHVPSDGTKPPETRPCTEEEIAAHIAENTNEDGTISEIGIFCRKDQPPKPPTPPSASPPKPE